MSIKSATRPAVGSVVNLPPAKTPYRPYNGEVPLGHIVGADGYLYSEAVAVELTSVRKIRAGWKCGTNKGFTITIGRKA